VSEHKRGAALLIILALGWMESCKSSRSAEDAGSGSERAGTSSREADGGGSTSPGADAGPAGAGGTSSQWSLTRDDADVVVGEVYRMCTQDHDCTLVGISCNGCCGQDAISRLREMTYRQELEAACRDYEGAICDCEPKALSAVCVQARCRALDHSQTCFSPTQNGDHARSPGGRGCSCEINGQRICVDGNRLVCQPVHTSEPVASQLAWTALPPESCGAFADCPAPNQRQTAEACLAEYRQCNQRNDGTFCGERCHGPLDCTAFACEDYQPPSSFACDPQGGPWEGICPDAGVRYRIERTGETRYWALDSGALIAVMTRSAAISACQGSDGSVFLGDVSVLTTCPALTDDGTAICLQDRCSDTTATRVADSCELELSAPLRAGAFCQAVVELNGQRLACDDPNGWTGLDRFHIRLDGTACTALRSGEPAVVRVRVACVDLPL